MAASERSKMVLHGPPRKTEASYATRGTKSISPTGNSRRSHRRKGRPRMRPIEKTKSFGQTPADFLRRKRPENFDSSCRRQRIARRDKHKGQKYEQHRDVQDCS